MRGTASMTAGAPAQARVGSILRGGRVLAGRFHYHGPDPRSVALRDVTELRFSEHGYRFTCAGCGDETQDASWVTERPCPQGCEQDYGCVEVNQPADEDGPEQDVMVLCTDCGGSCTFNLCPDCRQD